MTKKNETTMRTPITIVYDFLPNHPFGGYRATYTCYTYEEYERIVRVLHEDTENKYKVVSVTKGEPNQ